VANGGTGANTASGTSIDNISGFSSTGFLTRTGAGTYAFQSATNGITLGNIAQAAANTLLGNATASTANVTALSVPSCSSANQALNWTSSSGFGCVTISGGGGGSSGTGKIISTGFSDTASSSYTNYAWNSATAAAKTENLPACSSNAWMIVKVFDEKGTAQTYPINITPNGSDTINGVAAAVQVRSNYGSLTVTCDGVSNWMTN
jgi:hypothetical protein